MRSDTERPASWLPELRAQLDHGDLIGIGAVDVGGGFELPDGEAAARSMFEALDHYGELAPKTQHAPETRARMSLLLHDLRRVRDHVEARNRSRQPWTNASGRVPDAAVHARSQVPHTR